MDRDQTCELEGQTSINELLEDLARWSDETGIAPIKAWGGYALCRDNKPPSAEKVRRSEVRTSSKSSSAWR
mgnify:CR=1 FL=1